MTAQTNAKPRYGRAIVKLLLVVGILGAPTFLAVSASNIGFTTGLAASGAVLLVYAVPATIFDWPRLTLEDVVRSLGAIAAAIGAFFLALFGW